MAKKVKVGEDLYLFHGEEGRSEYLVISSHGATLNSFFTVPNENNLLFYAPKDRILQMHANFQLGIKVEEEVAPGTPSIDYGLSKFQGAARGGGGEDYVSIMDSIDRTRKSIKEGVQTWEQYLAAAGPFPEGFKPDQLAPQFKDYLKSKANLVPMDILTIRARGMRSIGIGDVKLSTVLNTLKQNNIIYPYVFCSFCRYTKGIETKHLTVGY